MYLIVKCKPLSDQFECDCDREPMLVVDDWTRHKPTDCFYEVYEINKTDGTLNLIREYDAYDEYGMVFGYRTNEDDVFHLIQKFPVRGRNDTCPEFILKFMSEHDVCDNTVDDYKLELDHCGHISIVTADDKLYIYGEYEDNHYPYGC